MEVCTLLLYASLPKEGIFPIGLLIKLAYIAFREDQE